MNPSEKSNPAPSGSRLAAFLRERRRQMPRRLPRLLLAAGLLLVPAVVVVRGLMVKKVVEAPPEAAAAGSVRLGAAAERNAGISVEAAKGLVRSSTFEAPGVLALDEARTSRIGSLVEGNVVRVTVEVGGRVTAGQRLAELHSHLIHDAWADYRKAVAERRRRETELAWAAQAAARAGRLLDEKALSQQEKDKAEVDRVAAAQELDRARTEVRRAEEALEHLGITNSEDPSGERGETIPVKSSLAGVVLEKHVTAGTAVTPGTPLFTVSDLSALWAMAEIDETRLPLVGVGRPAKVSVAAYPGKSFEARVTFVGDTVNAKTRRVTVRCQLPNPGGLLKPEMYARITLGEETPRKMVVVPAEAIQEMDGGPVVFVAGGQGRFEKRAVTLGGTEAGLVEVRSGVAEGDRVAARGSFLLKSELSKPAGE